MALEPGKIRNVAVVGHRGTGKTSLVEAMLFQAGAINRLGTVEQGSTVADWEDEEHKRQMSLSASICHLDWQGLGGQGATVSLRVDGISVLVTGASSGGPAALTVYSSAAVKRSPRSR